MTYIEKLITHYGEKPESLSYFQKINKIKTEEQAAKSMFSVLMTDRKDKARAKKLGLL